MAIEFVGGATASKSGSTSSSSVIALSGGLTGGIASAVAAGDLVIAVFGTGSTANRTLAITDGSNAYTLIGAEQFVADSFATNLRVAYKFMGETPDNSTTFGPTGNANDAGAMAVYVFRGVDPTTPLDVAAVQETGINTSRVVPPDITPSTAGAFVIVAGAAAHSGGVDTFTSSDLTAFMTVGGNDTSDVTVGIGHDPSWSSGATNYATWGHSQADSTSFSWAATTIALRPEATTVSHATSGALAGGASTIAGTAAHVAVHATSGVLATAGAAIAGSASSATTRAASGELIAAGAVVAGAAARTRVHAVTGALTGDAAEVAGTAARTRVHATSGALATAGATVAGSASSATARASSGALVAGGAAIAGTAALTKEHASDGVIVGSGAEVAGSAARVGLPPNHVTSGALAGDGATVDGAAARMRAHAASGILSAPGAIIVGAASGPTTDDGKLIAFVQMSLPRIPARHFHHKTHGRIVGKGARMSGAAKVTRTGQNRMALLMISV